MLRLHATIQQMPPDHAGGYDLGVDEVRVEAQEYAEAVEAVEAQVPQGWRVISLRVDRDLASL